MTALDWIFRALAVLLVLLAAGSVAAWLFLDQVRGRTKSPRCPKCWYDLSGLANGPSAATKEIVAGTPSTRCTECGHVATHPSQLHKGRRRWAFVPLALILLVLAPIAWSYPMADREGWRAAVPTWVIVRFWPLDEVRWMEGRSGQRFSMLDELSERLYEGKVSERSARAWSERVQRTFNRRTNFSERVLRIELAEIDSRKDASQPLGESEASEMLEGAIHLVVEVVEPDSWNVNGGIDGCVQRCGRSILFMHSPGVLERVQALLAAIREAAARARAGAPGQVRVELPESPGRDGKDLLIVIRDVRDIESDRARLDASPEEHMDDLIAMIEENVEPDTWVNAGGDLARHHRNGGLLLTCHTPEAQVKIDQYLAELRAAQGD